MSLSNKKSTTKTTEQSHLVQTPTNPAYVESGLAGVTGKINDLTNADPYSFVAGPDALQTQAGTAAGGLTSGAGFGQAQDILGGVAGAGPNLAGAPASLLDNLQAYMSPYTKDVVDTSLADYDFGSGQTRAQNKLSLAGDTTFGGSGGAIQTSLSNDAIDRGRGTLSAGLHDQAFTTGANLSNQDAQRRQQASQFDAAQKDNDLQRQIAAALGLSGNASAQGQDARENIGTQASIGDMLQRLAQARATAPLSLLGSQAALYSGLPLGLLHGNVADGTSSGTSATKVSDPIGQLSNLIASFGSAAKGLGSMGGGAG